MINRVLRIDLDDVIEGMTLSDTLLDPQGGVLLPQGAVLTEQTLKSLRRRGIEQISVINDDISEADLAAERERVQLRLDQLFKQCKGQGASDALLQSVMQYRFGKET